MVIFKIFLFLLTLSLVKSKNIQDLIRQYSPNREVVGLFDDDKEKIVQDDIKQVEFFQGHSYCQHSDRAAGGFPASRVHWLFLAKIGIRLSDYAHRHCDGSLIAKKWILTTGHCVLDRPIGNLLVKVGTSTCNQDGQVFFSNETFTHHGFKKFRKNFYNNDICLIKMKHKVINGLIYDYSTRGMRCFYQYLIRRIGKGL